MSLRLSILITFEWFEDLLRDPVGCLNLGRMIMVIMIRAKMAAIFQFSPMIIRPFDITAIWLRNENRSKDKVLILNSLAR